MQSGPPSLRTPPAASGRVCLKVVLKPRLVHRLQNLISWGLLINGACLNQRTRVEAR